MYVLGTAGHVDHGKSTLVFALTGIDPDRLAEEQRREMTIDLGFAHLRLPSGRQISIVDVPGHERFIKNMLAGVGGIDAALFVIAADEGVMPQTEEHLQILDLLEVRHGLVVLTKADLVDAEWLELVREDVRARLAGCVLEDAEMVEVSARHGIGLDELRRAIDRTLDRTPSRLEERGAPRLPIDRAFVVGGFGTVVTGTLADGPLEPGMELEILPRGLRARVRGLQTHGQKQDVALPGTRVAVNLGGIGVDELRRGDVLALPGRLRPTTLLDLKLRVVAGAPRPLRQNELLDLFVGAAEVACRVTLLDAEQLRPGDEGWVQLRLQHPLAVVRGDRCILRIPTPSLTIGGGRVLEPHPARHRRFRSDVITALETQSRGTPAERLLQALGDEPAELETAARSAGLDGPSAQTALAELAAAQRIAVLDERWIISQAAWERLRATIAAMLASYHQRYPLRWGMSREELRSRLGLRPGRAWDLLLRRAQEADVVEAGERSVRQAGWQPRLTAAQQRAVDELLLAFEREPWAPPARAEWEPLGAELIGFLLESGRLVRVSPDVLFEAAAYAKLVKWTEDTLERDGQVSVAALRDHFATSRKYALAFLEHLDERKLTRRQGEVRVRN